MEIIEETEIDNRDMGHWFVIQTLSGKENKIKDRLERRMAREGADFGIYEVLIPTEKVSEVRNGKKITTTRKYFPGYMLIRMDLYNEDNMLDEDLWYAVQHTDEVICFVGCADKPVPLSDQEVTDLLQQHNAGADDATARPKVQFELGETVHIKDGAFESFEGVVDEIDLERGKLKLMVAIFGRSTPVELEFWQVSRDA